MLFLAVSYYLNMSIEEFTLNVLSIVLYYKDVVVVDPEYKETVGWYAYRRGRLVEGIIPKGIRLLKNIEDIQITPISLITEVSSERSDDVYTVKIFLDLEKPLINFECDCKWGQYRLRPCKHVVASIIHPFTLMDLPISENDLIYGESYIIYRNTDVYKFLTQLHKALNISAYLKAKENLKYV